VKDRKIDMAAALIYLYIILNGSLRLRPAKVTTYAVLQSTTTVKFDYINKKMIELKYYGIFSEAFELTMTVNCRVKKCCC
jgi:hypothetical protein